MQTRKASSRSARISWSRNRTTPITTRGSASLVKRESIRESRGLSFSWRNTEWKRVEGRRKEEGSRKGRVETRERRERRKKREREREREIGGAYVHANSRIVIHRRSVDVSWRAKYEWVYRGSILATAACTSSSAWRASPFFFHLFPRVFLSLPLSPSSFSFEPLDRFFSSARNLGEDDAFERVWARLRLGRFCFIRQFFYY